MAEKLNIDMDALLELSKLQMDGAEKAEMACELDEFLDFLGQVGETVTSVENEYERGSVNVFRSDDIEQGFGPEEMLFNAKTKTNGYITVPRVVGEENG